MAYQILINSIDRVKDVLAQSVQIDDTLNDQVDTCAFQMIDRTGNGTPTNDQEIIIYDAAGTKVFGGYILTTTISKKGMGAAVIAVQCVDYTRLLDKNLVHKSYLAATDKSIIEDIVATYCAGTGITTTNVLLGVTINQISFNYIQPSQALKKLSQLSAKNWYIDYNKDLHYFPLTTNAAPYNITSSGNQFKDLKIKSDGSQLKNRVYVRGGTNLSDATVFSTKGDGAMKQFVLPDKAHNVSVTVDGVAKTVGIKNVNTSGFDYYLNFEEKYIEQDAGATVLGTGNTLAVTYQYDIPILIAQEDTASIAANGAHEFAIFDKTITTTNAARDRAIAELTDYANNMIEGSFITLTTGFKSGQYININYSAYGVNANYIVQKVHATSIGGGYFEYTISVASAKTMGIIKFLIELLEANRDLVQLDPNEVVDELFTITDSLLSDSLTDIVIDSVTTPPFQWKADNGSGGNLRWDLFQWG